MTAKEQPSIFLKQHILTVESKLATLEDNYLYWRLIGLGVTLHNGVIGTLPDTDLMLTPYGITGTLKQVPVQDLSEIVGQYLAYLHSLDNQLIEWAVELDARREDYANAVFREQLVPGGQLWWRNRNGIWGISIKHYEDGVLDFVVTDPPTQEHYTQGLRYLHLYLTKEEALNPELEGYNV